MLVCWGTCRGVGPQIVSLLLPTSSPPTPAPAAIAATVAALGGENIANDDSQILKQILVIAANLIS